VTEIKRKELEAALAQAEAVRESLEAALAKAKAALVNTVIDASKIDANQAEASAKVEKERARCRQLRAALSEFNQSNPIVTSHERGFILTGEPAEASEPEAAANPPSIQPSERASLVEEKQSRDESPRRKLSQRIDNAFARSPLVRQTIALVALTLAYLQYYYFDVHLQIMSLPRVVTLIAAPVANIS
jgi:hypothetical protein